MNNKKKFAIVLSGCGRADGSEIHEAVSLLLAIDQQGGEYEFFAPNISQTQVMNHITGKKMDEQRSVLIESARIARGNIKPLSEFSAGDFDAIVFPGGMGAVTNLCNCAVAGYNSEVNADVTWALNESYDKGLVIGAMCIAPLLIARVLGHYGIKITIGEAPSVVRQIESFGAEHIDKGATEVCVDQEHKIVTTPAYMLANSPKEVYQGAYKMVEEIIKLID